MVKTVLRFRREGKGGEGYNSYFFHGEEMC
jgi:hypothetical protein